MITKIKFGHCPACCNLFFVTFSLSFLTYFDFFDFSTTLPSATTYKMDMSVKYDKECLKVVWNFKANARLNFLACNYFFSSFCKPLKQERNKKRTLNWNGLRISNVSVTQSFPFSMNTSKTPLSFLLLFFEDGHLVVFPNALIWFVYPKIHIRTLVFVFETMTFKKNILLIEKISTQILYLVTDWVLLFTHSSV